MKKGILLHNVFHIFLPFALVDLILRSTPDLNLLYLLLTIFTGSFIPDLDHFTLWGKFYPRKLINFLEFCFSADRYRKGFLFFHNHLTLLFAAIFMIIFILINFYFTLFLFAFFVHLVYDYVSDILLIKTHSHWKFKRWL
jgi:hypothetical protein